MQIKPTMLFYFTLVRMAIIKKIISVGEDVKQGKSCVLGEIVKWFSHDGKQCGYFFFN